MPIPAHYPKRTFSPCPIGVHAAVCVDIVDLGEVATTFGVKNKLRYIWQTAEIDSATGRRFECIATFNNSFHKAANLRLMLQSWQGRAWTEDEAEQNARDLERWLGRCAQLTVSHATSANGRVYARIDEVRPLPPGTPPLAPWNYTRAKDRTPRSAAPVGAPSPASTLPDFETPLPDAPPLDDAPPFDDEDDISFAFGRNTGVQS